jgi:hypothetical protein
MLRFVEPRLLQALEGSAVDGLVATASDGNDRDEVQAGVVAVDDSVLRATEPCFAEAL